MKIPTKALIALLAVVALGGAACGDAFSAGAATVNGVSISQKALDERMKQMAGVGGQAGEEQRRQALFELIQETLLEQEAERRELTAAAAEIDDRYNQIKAQFPSEQEFEAEVTKRGFTTESLREAIADSIVQQKLAEALGEPITEEQLRQVYEQEKSRFEQVRARHILFSVQDQAQDARAKRRAEDALERIRAGESFATLARRLSDDPGSKEKGGDLGFLSRETVVPEFAEAAFSARVGRPVGPVRTQFGYHLILVVEKRVTPFAEAKEQLRQQLEQQLAQSSLQKFLDEALTSATIVINPRFGEWDAERRQIVPYRSFVPASPEAEPNLQPGFDLQPSQ